MMKSCQKTCELLSQQADRKLTWKERIQLKVHLSMCYGCRRYGQQIEGIENGMRQLRQQMVGLPEKNAENILPERNDSDKNHQC